MASRSSNSLALHTDKYELTMLQAALAAGTAHRKCVFEVFTRRLPAGRRYGVLAGVGRFLEALADFRFNSDQIEFLLNAGVIDTRTAAYLADFKFTGNIWGYREGELFFPGSPLLVVEADFAQGVLLETVLLSILNFDSAIASAAARMTCAAGSRPCLEMGSRRAHEEAAIAAARAATIAGFAGSSNLEAGRRWGLPTIGTAAHAFTLLHDDEAHAFAAQIAALGTETTLLVDTYDVAGGVERAIAAAGTGLGAVRLDSGDLGLLAHAVREQLDNLGARETKITVTSDLDEFAIAALAAAPVDSYGVGTALVTGSGAPTSSMVYKVVARQGADGVVVPVAKTAPGKASPGGAKNAARVFDREGRAESELVAVGALPAVKAWQPPAAARQLHVPLVRAGEIAPEYLGAAGVRAAAAHFAAVRQELAPTALRLSDGEPAIAVHNVAV